MSDNVVQFASFVKSAPTTKPNVVHQLITAFVDGYSSLLHNHKVDVENPDIAFDIATIQFLMQGMAHRSQGESHPSQILLNSMRSRILGDDN